MINEQSLQLFILGVSYLAGKMILLNYGITLGGTPIAIPLPGNFGNRDQWRSLNLFGFTAYRETRATRPHQIANNGALGTVS